MGSSVSADHKIWEEKEKKKTSERLLRILLKNNMITGCPSKPKSNAIPLLSSISVHEKFAGVFLVKKIG